MLLIGDIRQESEPTFGVGGRRRARVRHQRPQPVHEFQQASPRIRPERKPDRDPRRRLRRQAELLLRSRGESYRVRIDIDFKDFILLNVAVSQTCGFHTFI